MKASTGSCWRSTSNRRGSIVLGLWFREAIGGGLIMRVSRRLAEVGWLPFAASPR